MKQINFIIKTVLLISVCFFSLLNVQAQTQDFQLKIENYRGSIQWEQSFDHANWTIMPGATSGTYLTKPTKTTYYRAKITEAGCVPVYSNIKAASQYLDTFIAATLIKGVVELPANASVPVANCKVSSSLEEVQVNSLGQFEILIPDSTVENTLVVSNQLDSVIMLGHFYSPQSLFSVTVESTALALLHLYPGITPVSAQTKETYTQLYKKEAEFLALVNEVNRISKNNFYLFSTSNTDLKNLLSTLIKKPFNLTRLRLSRTQLSNPVYINSSGSVPDKLIITNTASFSYMGVINKKDNTPVSDSYFNVAGSMIKGSSMAKLLYEILYGYSYNISKSEVRIDLKGELNQPPGEYIIKLRSGLKNENTTLNNLAFNQNIRELFCLTASGLLGLSVPLKSSCVKDIVISGLNGIKVANVTDIITNGGSVVQDLIFPIIKNIGTFLASDEGFSCLPKTNFSKLIPIINLVDQSLPSAYFTSDWKLSNNDIDACQYMDDEFYLMPCFKMEAQKLPKNKFYTGDTVSVEVISKVDKFYYPYTEEPAAFKRFVWYSPSGGSFAPGNYVNVPDRTSNVGKATIKFIMPCNETKTAIRTVFAGIPESLNMDVFSLDAYHPKLKIVTTGSGQTGVTGMELANPLRISLIDELDNLPMFMNRFTIQWKNTGTGKITPAKNDGINSGIIDSAFTWTLGLETGQQVVEATVAPKNCNWPLPNNVATFTAQTQEYILSGFTFTNIRRIGQECPGFYKSCQYDIKVSFVSDKAPTSGTLVWKIDWDNQSDGVFEGSTGLLTTIINSQNSDGKNIIFPAGCCWGSSTVKLRMSVKYKGPDGKEGEFVSNLIPQY